MIWAMAALVVILLLLIATGNLRLMIGFLCVVVVVITLLLVFDVFEEKRSSARIALEQIQLQDFTIEESRASIFELKGRIQNDSPEFGLFRLGLRVQALDCPDAETSVERCTVIGDQVQELSVDVPAGQARDLAKRIRFADAPLTPRGLLRWQFEVVGTGGG